APEQILEYISAIALRIYQSLDLDEILNTTVAEVRQLLQTDRVVIYRLNSDGSGVVAVESVGEDWMPIKGQYINDPCLQTTWVEPYREGRVRAIADIYTTGLEECHINLLAQFQVRANLVVPILQTEQKIKNQKSKIQNHLWGLLLVHHCADARQWHSSELDLLEKLTTHVALAIQKAYLYQQSQIELAERERAQAALQSLNEELETKVLERTAQFRQVNEQLQAEIAERLQVQRGLQESQFCSRLLNTISTGRTAGLGMAEIIDSTLKQIHQFFRHLGVIYYTINEQHQLKVCQSIQPAGMPPCRGSIIDLKEASDCFNNLQLGIPLIAEDVTQEAVLIPLTNLIQASQVRSLLAVPLKYSDRLVGLISLHSCQVYRWSEYEIGTFIEIAEYLSFTLQEAHVQQERQQALLDLQAQAQLLDLAHDTIMVHDVKGRIIFWNQGAVEMYGYEQQEAIGQNATKLLQTKFPASIEEVQEQLQVCGRWEGELIHTKRDRSLVVVASRWALIRDKNGTPVKILEINSDITKRVQAEQELRESETFIRALYQVATNPHLSLSDRFQNVLAMGCQYFDLEYSFLAKVEGDRYETIAVQTPDQSVSVGDTIDVRQTYCVETLQQEEMLWIQHASASEKWRKHPGYATTQIETYIGMRILVNNNVYGVLCFCSPVAHLRPIRSVDKELLKLMIQWIGSEIERYSAAQTLERLQHQNELILNSAGEGICGVDVHGNITFVNPTAAKMLGYSVQELINKPIQATLFPSKEDGTPRTLDETFLYSVLKKATVQQFKNQLFWRSDGSSFPVECIATPMIDGLGQKKPSFLGRLGDTPTV
ncbi:MAG TPA: GAF domain-containing protein, partial [Candidatus Obscuribacterales bacterium]